MTVKAITGGDKLAAKLQEIAKGLEKGGTLSVGFLEGATYPDGTPVAMVAAIQEFGAPRASIPPRPFMRTTVAKHSDEWGDKLGRALKYTEFDAGQALGLMGEVIVPEIQESIVDVDSPPLSPITLMLRKMRSEDQSLVVTGKTVGEAAARVAAGESTAGVNTKPLQDSGHLKSSVDYEVKDQAP